MKAQRYDAIMREIDRMPVGRIRLMEIGTCKGERAERMIEAAKRRRVPHLIEYYGFDLFEKPPARELSERTPPDDVKIVRARLEKTGVGVSLYKGDTHVTLPENVLGLPVMDIIFIDGGHSTETIAADWENVQPLVAEKTVIFFDDFWNYGEGGCNQVVAEIARTGHSVKVLDPPDRFRRPWGVLETKLVRVTL